MRGEANVTLPKAYCISLPLDNMHCFYTSAFLTLCFILSVMDGKTEQHVCIKFCVKLCKYTTETLEMLCEASAEHSLSQREIFEWHSRLKAGQASVEDDKHSGQPSNDKMTEKVEKI
jgi:hypothetical protein